MPVEGSGFPGSWFRPVLRPLFRSLAIPASGMSAQRRRIDVIANNIANAQTTRTAEGGPYQRRVVALEAQGYAPQYPAASLPNGVGVPEVPRPVPPEPGELPDPADALGGVRVAGVVEDVSEGPLVYDPGHPDADAAGYVRYPNVRLTDEMIDLMEARRVYEANATVFQAVKSMLRRAMEI